MKTYAIERFGLVILGVVLTNVLSMLQVMTYRIEYPWHWFVIPTFGGVLFGTTLMLYQRQKILSRENRLLATTDRLTSTLNRYASELVFEKEAHRCVRNKTPLSLIIIDIDDFKKINDLHGHHVGDRVLKEVSELLRSEIRDKDSLGRWGGEEFVLILPEIQQQAVKQLGERLCRTVSNYDFRIGTPVTISIGGAFAKREPLTLQEIFRRADEALYRVKRSGKNDIALDGEAPFQTAA